MQLTDRPLKRKKQSTLSDKPITVLRENERELKLDSVMQKVANKLDMIEQSVQKERIAPPMKKRRRI